VTGFSRIGQLQKVGGLEREKSIQDGVEPDLTTG